MRSTPRCDAEYERGPDGSNARSCVGCVALALVIFGSAGGSRVRGDVDSDGCTLAVTGRDPTELHFVPVVPTPFKVVYGSLSDLRAEGDYSLVDCLGTFSESPGIDVLAEPASGDGRYYLAHGVASCTDYGDSSLAPDPRDALDLDDPCPEPCAVSGPEAIVGLWHYCEDCDKTGLQPQSCIEFGIDGTLAFTLPTLECCDCPGACPANVSFGNWEVDTGECTVAIGVDAVQIVDPSACWVEESAPIPLSVVSFDGDTLVLALGGFSLTLERDASNLACYCTLP